MSVGVYAEDLWVIYSLIKKKYIYIIQCRVMHFSIISFAFSYFVSSVNWCEIFNQTKHKIKSHKLSLCVSTVRSRKLRRFSVATLTLLTLMLMHMTRVRRRKRIKMKKAGTDPRSKLRGGWGGKAFLRSTSQVSSKVVT